MALDGKKMKVYGPSLAMTDNWEQRITQLGTKTTHEYAIYQLFSTAVGWSAWKEFLPDRFANLKLLITRAIRLLTAATIRFHCVSSSHHFCCDSALSVFASKCQGEFMPGWLLFVISGILAGGIPGTCHVTALLWVLFFGLFGFGFVCFCVFLCFFFFGGWFLVFWFALFCFVFWMIVTVHRTMYRSSTSLLLRPL